MARLPVLDFSVFNSQALFNSTSHEFAVQHKFKCPGERELPPIQALEDSEGRGISLFCGAPDGRLERADGRDRLAEGLAFAASCLVAVSALAVTIASANL